MINPKDKYAVRKMAVDIIENSLKKHGHRTETVELCEIKTFVKYHIRVEGEVRGGGWDTRDEARYNLIRLIEEGTIPPFPYPAGVIEITYACDPPMGIDEALRSMVAQCMSTSPEKKV